MRFPTGNYAPLSSREPSLPSARTDGATRMLDDAMKLRLRQKYDALDIDGSGLLEQNEVETLISKV